MPPYKRVVTGSKPVAPTTAGQSYQPSHLRKRRKRDDPGDAGSARAGQNPHNQPAVAPDGRRRPEARAAALAAGTPRESARGDGEVIELDHGITVYPACSEGGRWRATWHESGQRQQCEAATEEKLAAELEKVTERLAVDAPNITKPGADLIAHYLDLDRLPVAKRWSRRHADNQRQLCQRFAAPVIAAVTCQDITTGHTQKIVNAAPTAGEGDRARRMLSALVNAGIEGGYLVSPRLAKVQWRAADRPLPAPAVTVAGESPLWVDPAEIPSDDITSLGRALAAGRQGDCGELMAYTAAYSGLRWPPNGSPPASTKPAPSRKPGATPSGWSSPPPPDGTGAPPTSAAASRCRPTGRPVA